MESEKKKTILDECRELSREMAMSDYLPKCDRDILKDQRDRMVRQLISSMKGLTIIEQQVVMKRYVELKSNKEIALELHINYQTVKNYLTKARKHITLTLPS